MTREDILRELELLPAWSLRTPLLSGAVNQKQNSTSLGQVNSGSPLNEVAVIIATGEPLISASVTSEQVITKVTQKSQALQYMASEDADWLFLLSSAELATDEVILFRNISNAMQIRVKPLKTALNIKELLDTTQAKLLIAMGESTAQYLLNSAESLENLRGVIHAAHGAALLVTYDLKHLLQTLPDKAKAWDDLCLAMQILQHLKSGDS